MNRVILNALFPGEPVAWMRAASMGKRRFTPKKMRDAQQKLRWELKTIAPNLKPSSAYFGTQMVFTVREFGKDGDNLQKLVWDAFNGVIWHDDDQIVEWTGKKVRAGPKETGSTRIVVYVIEGAQ